MSDSSALEPPSLRLETFLPYRLNVVAAEISQALAGIYGARFGISIPEWRVLATLGQFGEATARAVGAHSRMHKTSVSRAVGALEGRGLIARRANAADRREAFLTLTDAGRAIYLEIVPLASAFAENLCAGFTAEERRVFDRLLDALLARMDFGSDRLDAPGTSNGLFP